MGNGYFQVRRADLSAKSQLRAAEQEEKRRRALRLRETEPEVPITVLAKRLRVGVAMLRRWFEQEQA